MPTVHILNNTDIIYFDNEVIDLPNLTVPHRDMANRDFVLAPLCEIAPDFIHPVLRKTNRELLEEVKEKVKKRRKR